MDRRDFVRLSIAGAGTGIIAPQIALADAENPSYAGSVYFTKESPGRWDKKSTPHIPYIELDKQEGKLNIKVTTPHPMDGHKHYIVKHVLLGKKFNFLEEFMFDPMKDKAAISTYSFSISSYSGPIYALSMCNKHDIWLNSATV